MDIDDEVLNLLDKELNFEKKTKQTETVKRPNTT